MTRKNWILVSIVVVLTGLYAVYFTDWFRPKFIRIEHTVRSLREAWGVNGGADPTGQQANNVTFSLHKNYRLTAVKVVLAADIETNKYALPLWQLVARKGSEPVNGISYGLPIPGMELARKGAETQPLQPGVTYRLLLDTGSVKGQHDFMIPASTAARR